jgi:hypothetical protein
LADVKPAQLKVWLETEKFRPATVGKSTAVMVGVEPFYYFNHDDVQRLIEFAASQQKRKPSKDNRFIDDGVQTDFTVAQIASMWQLSTDTIQRLFEDEPGVVALAIGTHVASENVSPSEFLGL